jgi:hypothetical protein
MPRGGHGRSGPPPASQEDRKLRGSRTRAHHRKIEHGQNVADDIERELAQSLGSTSTDETPAAGADASSSSGVDTPGAPLVGTGCEPPDGLSDLELKFWKYYAPKLKAQGRLKLLTRDVLAGYCSALAVIADIRADLAAKDVDRKEKAAARKELRQYLAIKRMYENDLLLNPATASRISPFDDPPPAPDPAETAETRDEFDEQFDDDSARAN